ncbi:MAG: prepilin-type N-terminal cleavage/methylation domain-containing protein [Sulfurimonas sp.]|nr:prepilin-type N-terminal cleavage/methylation domain-containing protein [Sulfurimonas sp.]
MRRAFTLIEMMVSITILAIMMVYLYQSYASLNSSNTLLQRATDNIKEIELKKRVVFLDFSLALKSDAKGHLNILNQSAEEDVVVMQSSHSLHKRHNPYVGYLVKNKKLYRIESLKPLNRYPLGVESEFEADMLGEVKSFRVYKNKPKEDNASEAYLVHIDFEKEEDILLKVKMLNQ